MAKNLIAIDAEELTNLTGDRDAFRKVAHLSTQRIDKAVKAAADWGWIDGGHHKMWVIDQMLRILLADRYEEWVKEFENGGEYEWDTGIAP